MPSERGSKRTLSVYLKEDTEKIIKEIHIETKIPIPNILKGIIEEGLIQTEAAAKLGWLQLAIALRDLRDWVTNSDTEEKLEGKKTTLWVEKSFVNRLKVIGDKGGISATKLASNLLIVGIEDKQLKKWLAELSFPRALKKWGEKIEENFRKGREKEKESLI